MRTLHASDALEFLNNYLLHEKYENEEMQNNTITNAILNNDSDHNLYLFTDIQRKEIEMSKLEQERTNATPENDTEKYQQENIQYAPDWFIDPQTFDGKTFEGVRITANECKDGIHKMVNIYHDNFKILKIHAFSVSLEGSLFEVSGEIYFQFSNSTNPSGKFARVCNFMRDDKILLSVVGTCRTEHQNYRIEAKQL